VLSVHARHTGRRLLRIDARRRYEERHLVRAFVDEVRAQRGGRGLEVTLEALPVLASYPWPGNVRELRAEVMRWGIFCDEGVDVADLAPEIRSPAARPAPLAAPITLALAVEAAERTAIEQAVDAHAGNLSRAARALDIDRNTLKRKLARYGLRAAPESGR
jgi:two-component system response regulator AtoC